MRFCVAMLVSALLALFALAGSARADGPESGFATLQLTAALGAGPVLESGLRWRIFALRADAEGGHSVIMESALPQPVLTLPPGDYVIHAAFGLASVAKIVTLTAKVHSERLTLAAGALRIHGVREDSPVDPAKLSLDIYVPERNNSQAKLVYARARAGDVIGVPEGLYHIASTYLDTVGVGSLGVAANTAVPTNSIVGGDVRVAAGKIVDVTLRHRCATLTIKLVNTKGSDALANTTFTVLTPGGDVIRELIGAFPSLVLAEGEYVVVARHDSKTYQATFEVQSGMDRDVEVIAKEEPKKGP